MYEIWITDYFNPMLLMSIKENWFIYIHYKSIITQHCIVHFNSWGITLYIHHEIYTQGRHLIYVIPPHWYDTVSWNPSSCKTRTYLFYIVNITASAKTRTTRTHAFWEYCLIITQTIDSYEIKSNKTKSKLQILKICQKFKFWNFTKKTLTPDTPPEVA